MSHRKHSRKLGKVGYQARLLYLYNNSWKQKRSHWIERKNQWNAIWRSLGCTLKPEKCRVVKSGVHAAQGICWPDYRASQIRWHISFELGGHSAQQLWKTVIFRAGRTSVAITVSSTTESQWAASDLILNISCRYWKHDYFPLFLNVTLTLRHIY